MHKSIAETIAFAGDFAKRVRDVSDVEIAIAPPFTSLSALRAALGTTRIALAGQNAHFEAKGAFTGEISVAMLADTGCRAT